MWTIIILQLTHPDPDNAGVHVRQRGLSAADTPEHTSHVLTNMLSTCHTDTKFTGDVRFQSIGTIGGIYRTTIIL